MILGADETFAFNSAVFTIFSPAFPFLTAVYSESLFNLLITSGLIAFYHRQRFIAAIFWCLAGLTRSNGIVMMGFFLYDAISHVFHRSRRTILRSLMGIMVVASGFIAFEYYGFVLYCTPTASRSWCVKTIPDLYGFVQQHYWNVRLWKYYTVTQTPNFLIAAPTMILCVATCYVYCKSNWRNVFGFRLDRCREPSQVFLIAYESMLPHICLMAFMMIYTLMVVHVQISARLFSFQPLIYWAFAHFYSTGSPVVKKCIVFYALGYATIGTVLFMNFYPPA